MQTIGILINAALIGYALFCGIIQLIGWLEQNVDR